MFRRKFWVLFLDLYHVCGDPRLAETNDRVIQINDTLQKDYQSAIGLPEHRHLLTVRTKGKIDLTYAYYYYYFCFSGLMVLAQW